MTENELLKLKKEIEAAKTEVSELKGEEKALLKELEDTWECATLPQAKVKIKEMDSVLAKLQEELTLASEELENELSLIRGV